MSVFEDVRRLRLFLKVRARLREASKMKTLKVAAFSLAGMVLSGAVAAVTGACPDIVSAAPAIVMAGLGGLTTYLMRRPAAKAGMKALAIGAGAALLGAVVQQVNQVCGPGFVDKIPALAVASLWVSFGMWLKSPHQVERAATDLGTVTPPSLKG